MCTWQTIDNCYSSLGNFAFLATLYCQQISRVPNFLDSLTRLTVFKRGAGSGSFRFRPPFTLLPALPAPCLEGTGQRRGKGKQEDNACVCEGCGRNAHHHESEETQNRFNAASRAVDLEVCAFWRIFLVPVRVSELGHRDAGQTRGGGMVELGLGLRDRLGARCLLRPALVVYAACLPAGGGRCC